MASAAVKYYRAVIKLLLVHISLLSPLCVWFCVRCWFVIHMASLRVISSLTIILLGERESCRGGSRVSGKGVHM